ELCDPSAHMPHVGAMAADEHHQERRSIRDVGQLHRVTGHDVREREVWRLGPQRQHLRLDAHAFSVNAARGYVCPAQRAAATRASTSRLAIANPSPVPPASAEVTKRSKTNGTSSLGIPGPASSTSKTTSPAALRTRIVTDVPAGL